MPTCHAWMLEVLKDLCTYSEEHEFFHSQDALEAALLVVKDDICRDGKEMDISHVRRAKLTLVN